MHLDTPRLTIRSFVPEDAADLQEILGDAQTMEYSEPPYDLEKTKQFLSSFCIARGGGVAAVHREKNKVIGYILFSQIQPGEYELGWFFNRQFWRQGYAFEACHAVIEYAFDTLGAKKVFSETIDGGKSVAFMEKLGMELEEVQPDPEHGWQWYVYAIQREGREANG